MVRTSRLFWSSAIGLMCCVAAAPARCCPTQGQESAQVAGIEARLEVRLTDGRLIRLAGLDPASPTPDAPDLPDISQAQLSAMLAKKLVTLTPMAGAPDRWGRIPAVLLSVDDGNSTDKGPSGGIAARAIAAGLGRYLAEPAAHACRDELISAERKARAAKLGLWRDPYYAVLPIDDHAGFAERSATIVVAEGRLSAVQPSLYRTTLRFAAPLEHAHGGFMLVATILPRVMKTFESEHVNVRTLIGRRLRFRGLLDLRFGPRIELAGPDALETDLDHNLAATPAGAD